MEKVLETHSASPALILAEKVGKSPIYSLISDNA